MQPAKLTPIQAKQIGFYKTLKFLLILLAVWECIWFFRETSGDLANGILFYISNHQQYQVLAIYFTTFITLLFLGRKAGYDILITRKKPTQSAVKFISLSLIIIWGVIFLITRIEGMNLSWDDYSQIVVLDIFVSIPVILIWILTIYTIVNVFTSSTTNT